ncbi:MAG: hypothetical protein A2Z96_02820 [Spirochaetes bacterium GWB1_48_6]|nr:MAG: hypothetical protein A2Z96_02820 [Spirochaetes bacterium GWB1_48_6]
MKEFSINRIFWLIRNRALQTLIPLGIGVLILLGIRILHFIFSQLTGAPYSPGDSSGNSYSWLVVLACFLTSAGAFKEMQSAKSTTEWLLLPATGLEKYLSAFVEMMILIPSIAVVLAMGFSWLDGQFWIPFTEDSGMIWEKWGIFLVTNLLFFTGSTFYRKLVILKTLGTILAFITILGLVLAFGSKILFDQGTFASMMTFGDSDGGFAWKEMHKSWDKGNFLLGLWKGFYFVLTPVFALSFGYFRVKEKEAHHAVQ